MSTITESSQNTFSIGNVLKSLRSLTNSVIDEFVRFSLSLIYTSLVGGLLERLHS